MPTSWPSKEERQYKKIKESVEKSGKDARRSKEIAARTVNKKRREAGETANKKTMGTGNPRTSLHSRTKDELMNSARKMNIPGRSRMTKDELIKALRKGKA